MISATNIYKAYGDLAILKGVNLEIQEREVVSIVGASGAGKTTLLQLLGTLDRPTDAQKNNTKIQIDTTDVALLSDKDLSRFRNQKLGFIFQFHQLLPELTARENAMLPALIGKESKSQASNRAIQLLDFLGLKERVNHKPNQLSGGEQQRVAIARALVNKPKVVFADEPSGNLDSKNAEELHQLFFRLREEFNQTFVIVTHNKDLANMADRTLVMNDGNIVANAQ